MFNLVPSSGFYGDMAKNVITSLMRQPAAIFPQVYLNSDYWSITHMKQICKNVLYPMGKHFKILLLSNCPMVKIMAKPITAHQPSQWHRKILRNTLNCLTCLNTHSNLNPWHWVYAPIISASFPLSKFSSLNTYKLIRLELKTVWA